MKSRLLRIATIALATAAAALALGALRPSARAAACTREGIIPGSARFCGPATASLSRFRGFTFRNGTCLRQVPNGDVGIGLQLGALSLIRDVPYLQINVDRPGHVTRVDVLAHYHGKDWAGIGTSFRGDWHGGTFAVHGNAALGFHGTVTGSFHC